MTKPQATVTIRRATVEDAPVCGKICYDAFCTLNRAHNFPCDFPGPEVTTGVLSMMFSAPDFYCVVAESEGRVVGSNCLDERSVIAGVGPITVDPAVQSAGIGRVLMRAVMERAKERRAAGVRLVQAAFHTRSLSLYASLGFDAREPLSVMQGPAIKKKLEGCAVRPAVMEDLAACNRVCVQVHGHDRGGDLADAITQGTAAVVERHGRITA